jgi:hypothetical protein
MVLSGASLGVGPGVVTRKGTPRIFHWWAMLLGRLSFTADGTKHTVSESIEEHGADPPGFRGSHNASSLSL